MAFVLKTKLVTSPSGLFCDSTSEDCRQRFMRITLFSLICKASKQDETVNDQVMDIPPKYCLEHGNCCSIV